MAHILTDGELNALLEGSWDVLCGFAYEHFLNHGRGVIGIDRTPADDDYQLMYATVGEDSLFDDTIKTTVAKYDPETELVLNCACGQDRYRTVRLKSQNGRGPESVWVERMMRRGEE